MLGLLILGILNAMYSNSLQARDLTFWCCNEQRLQSADILGAWWLAPVESLYSLKTLAHLPPAPSQPLKEDCGLLLCISYVQCDCCITCHCCFLSSFARCPESCSLVIWRGEETAILCSHSYGEFSSLDFSEMQTLDPHLDFLQSWTTRSGSGSFGLPGLWLTSFCWQTV